VALCRDAGLAAEPFEQQLSLVGEIIEGTGHLVWHGAAAFPFALWTTFVSTV